MTPSKWLFNYLKRVATHRLRTADLEALNLYGESRTVFHFSSQFIHNLKYMYTNLFHLPCNMVTRVIREAEESRGKILLCTCRKPLAVRERFWSAHLRNWEVSVSGSLWARTVGETMWGWEGRGQSTYANGPWSGIWKTWETITETKTGMCHGLLAIFQESYFLLCGEQVRRTQKWKWEKSSYEIMTMVQNLNSRVSNLAPMMQYWGSLSSLWNLLKYSFVNIQYLHA